MKKKSGRIVFCVAVLIVFLLMAAVLELSKNTLPGFILLAIVTCCFAFVFVKKLSGGKALFKVLGWLCFVILFAVILIATKPPVKAIPAADYKNIVRTDIVETEKGQVRGVLSEDGEIEIYAGIPYAKPPVGPLRWKEPVSPEAWEGVLEADSFAPMSMQPTNLPIYDSLAQIIGYHDYKISLKDNFVAPVSEDSLYLNIWKPAGDVENLPVLVYIHGGSLQTGQPWYEDYSGQGLAREGVIVVNMGYRLGVFGFLADENLAAESANDTTGNYGLLDQIKALEWVRDNIAAFGGDPENVTLSGESAGSACVSALCTSPLAKGLFKRVLLESSTVTAVSPTHSFRLLPEALESGKELKERYNAQYINDLRKIDAKKLVKEADTQHHMTVDGYVLEKTPHEAYLAGEFNEEKIIHGYNLHEGEAFILFDQANLSNYEKKVRDYFGELADEVFEIENMNGLFHITSSHGIYESAVCILAAGSSRKTLPIKGLSDYEGKGVSYCAVCDGFFYKNLPVAVIGNAEYAVSEAKHLTSIASEVTILTNGLSMTASVPDEIKVNESPIASIEGDDLLHKVVFKDGSTLDVEGVFVAIGTASSVDLARKLGVVDSEGKIDVDENMATFIPGFYTAGDCNGGLLQVAKAVGEGAIAGTSAVKYVKSLKSK